jgi:putative transposase
MRNIKGFKWNHQRVYCIYKQLELNLRIKPRRRIKRDKPDALSVPIAINQTWSMDFMSDSLNAGRSIRTFDVVDDYNIECLGIEVDHSLLAQRVIQSLERLIEWSGKPKAIRCDNGPEYISQALRDWAQAMGIGLLYTTRQANTECLY